MVDERAGVVTTESLAAGSTVLADGLVGNASATRSVLLPGRVYAAILRKLRSVVQEAGGQLYFAYLPSLPAARDPACDPSQDALRGLLRAAGIALIDTAVPLRASGDLGSLFAIEHLTAKGYRIVAGAILAGLGS